LALFNAAVNFIMAELCEIRDQGSEIRDGEQHNDHDCREWPERTGAAEKQAASDAQKLEAGNRNWKMEIGK
jgi:hypothetical protein